MCYDPPHLQAATSRIRRRSADPAPSSARILGDEDHTTAQADAPPRRAMAPRRQSRHDFDAALVDLDAALAKDPDDVQAWLTRSVLLSVRADYVRALESCGPVARGAGPFAGAMCSAPVLSLTGRAPGAYASVLR